eukprot:10437737-Lingulodinium_polyedra.AAC.1
MLCVWLFAQHWALHTVVHADNTFAAGVAQALVGCGPRPTLVQMVRILVVMVCDDGYSLDFVHVAARAGNPWNGMADWPCSAQADHIDD